MGCCTSTTINVTAGGELHLEGLKLSTSLAVPLDTPLLASIDASGSGRLVKALERAIPMGRLARPEDFCEVVSLFLSPRSGYITGQTISVSGGLTMHG